tara:strand:- start:850 stop:1074 length:225 start_codon:yes stop_codon:yes gene_type:complete
MPQTQQKHYIVGYHDTQHHHFEICEYAVDSYEAIAHSKEDVPELKEHPSFIDYCVSEEVENIANLMESGIPMGH